MTIGTGELVAYCGLCCQDCSGYKGKIADLAREYHDGALEPKSA